MFCHLHHIRYYRARGRELSGAASVKHGVAKHITMYEDGIKYIIYTVKRVCSGESRCGATIAQYVPSACLCWIASSLIALPIAFAYLKSIAVIFVMPFGMDIFKIHLLSCLQEKLRSRSFCMRHSLPHPQSDLSPHIPSSCASFNTSVKFQSFIWPSWSAYSLWFRLRYR